MFLDAATFFNINEDWTLGKAKAVWKKAYHTDEVSLLWQTLVDRLLVDDVEEDDSVKLHELLRTLGQRIATENQGKRRSATEWLGILRGAGDFDEQDIDAPWLTAEGGDSKDTSHTSTRLRGLNNKQDNLRVSIPITIDGARGGLEDLSALGGINAPWVPADGDESEDSKHSSPNTSTTHHRLYQKQDLEVSIPVTIDEAKSLEDFSDLAPLNTTKHLLITKFPGSSLPGDIGQLVALQQLQIQDCAHVDELPDSFGQLIDLKRLVILNCPSLSGIKESLGSLKTLRNLRIQDCDGLKDLPGTLGRLCGLEQLIIWNCSGLTAIPNTIGQLGALRHLLIHGCEGLTGLPQSFSQLEGLEHLIVSSCPRLTEIPLQIGQLWSLKHLRIQDCESLNILPETLKQVGALEHVTISNCSNVSTFLRAYGDEFLEARAPARHAEQMSTTSMIAFIAALETGGRHSYLLSTQWLLNLQDHEKEMLGSICMKTGYKVTYQTTSNTYYEGSNDHVQNIGPIRDGGRAVDNATSSGVCETTENSLPKHLQRLQIDDGFDMICSSGGLSVTQSGINPGGEADDGRRVDKAIWSVSQTSGDLGGDKHLHRCCTVDRVGISGVSSVSVATETRKERVDTRTCAPKLLRVNCCGSNYATEPSEVYFGRHHIVKHFGACLVTLPRHEDFAISTVVEQTIILPTYQWRASGLVEEHVSLRIFVETTVSCCLRSEDNPKKVHVEISKIRGEIKYVNIADPRNHDTFLQSARTNVWGRIDHGGLSEIVPFEFVGGANLGTFRTQS